MRQIWVARLWAQLADFLWLSWGQPNDQKVGYPNFLRRAARRAARQKLGTPTFCDIFVVVDVVLIIVDVDTDVVDAVSDVVWAVGIDDFDV